MAGWRRRIRLITAGAFRLATASPNRAHAPADLYRYNGIWRGPEKIQLPSLPARFRPALSLLGMLFPKKRLQFLRAKWAIEGAADDPLPVCVWCGMNHVNEQVPQHPRP
jgi:hypothetical protein